jgi:hypothetical protein
MQASKQANNQTLSKKERKKDQADKRIKSQPNQKLEKKQDNT